MNKIGRGRNRKIDRSVHLVHEFDSSTQFIESDNLSAGISVIRENGIPIDLLISPTSSNTTIFFFHGAIEPHFSVPVLSGLGISGGLEANRVFVSDPSLVLDEELMLAWYAGNSFQPNLQELLSEIFHKIVSSLGTTRTVFFGGSGGGFASLYFASKFPGSLALVFNPQTNISNYAPKAVEDFARKAFDIEKVTSNALLKDVPQNIVTDLCHHYMSAPETTIAYLQNTNDVAHMNNHLQPFYRALRPPTDFLLLADAWGLGHTPPPKEVLARLLTLASRSRDWENDLQDIGFIKCHT